MPYLQLDVARSYPVEVKRELARRIGETYARIMQTRPDIVSVTIRELGEGGMWHCTDGDPVEGALLMCDIRRGRPPEQRAELGKALVEVCVEVLGLSSERVPVEFTQHAGDEMYRYGRGLASDWNPAESQAAAANAR